MGLAKNLGVAQATAAQAKGILKDLAASEQDVDEKFLAAFGHKKQAINATIIALSSVKDDAITVSHDNTTVEGKVENGTVKVNVTSKDVNGTAAVKVSNES